MTTGMNISVRQVSIRAGHARPLLLIVGLPLPGLTMPQQTKFARQVFDNCAALLRVARHHNYPVAHFRRSIADAKQFVESPRIFRPIRNEMVFEHAHASCYSSPEFERMTCFVDIPVLLVAGFGAYSTGLATAIDATARQTKVMFVKQALATSSGDLVTPPLISRIAASGGSFVHMRSALREMREQVGL